jgi:hypothetical protein
LELRERLLDFHRRDAERRRERALRKLHTLCESSASLRVSAVNSNFHPLQIQTDQLLRFLPEWLLLLPFPFGLDYDAVFIIRSNTQTKRGINEPDGYN